MRIKTTGDLFDHLSPLSPGELESMLASLPPSALMRAKLSHVIRAYKGHLGTLTYASQPAGVYEEALDRALASIVGKIAIPDYIVVAMLALPSEDLTGAVQAHMLQIDEAESIPEKQKRVFSLLLREIAELHRRKNAGLN